MAFKDRALSILEKINSSADIKKLSRTELTELCEEIRKFEIDSISRTGGHLASNLGTVELTLALHRVYDTSKDRLIFDVGHQCYTHKIITGRKELFHTLRQHDGIAGFPKPNESNDDAFIAGHASNSVSVALGMAKARTLSNEDYEIVAMIGDGALTGGLAYEGLINAAASNEPMVVILNDNNMSISENVGGMAQLLPNLRMRPSYINFKKWFRGVTEKLPVLYYAVHHIKEWLKDKMLPGNVFSEMGFYYLGPVDGHNLYKLEEAISLAKDVRKPVLLHVLTTKGKGFASAENHPDKYHGVGSFDPVTGELAPSSPGFSDKVGEYLCQYAERDSRIVVCTAAMAGGTGTECFGTKFPDRFYDVGIAEGHSVSMSAGMAKQGMVPVFAVYSSFLQRSFDMLIHDISLLGLHVVFCVDRAGLVGNDGETHHGVFDVSYLSMVPGMTILCPASFQELHDMLGHAIMNLSGPVAVRYPRGSEGRYTQSCMEAEHILREGEDITIICYGTMVNEVLDAADQLEQQGISAEIIKLGMVSPNDYKISLQSIEKTGKVIIPEEVCNFGCVGNTILSLVASQGMVIDASKLMNLGSGIVPHGTVKELRHDTGIDAEAIVATGLEMCGKSAEVL